MNEMSREDLVNELSKQNDLIEKMKKDYRIDIDRKNKEIEFLKSECKRIYDPIREFWNTEKNEELEKLRKENETLKRGLNE